MKTAILQCADTGPLDSLVLMLRAVGYQCALPSLKLLDELKRLGCDTVLSVQELVREWGYERPITLPEVGVADLARQDVLYVDVKAHRNGPIVWKRWPHLEKRTLWYRINGGRPEHVITKDGFDCGDERNPPCPVLTPNLWYRDTSVTWTTDGRETYHTSDNHALGVEWRHTPWAGRAYACWPPFYRFDEYGVRRHPKTELEPCPECGTDQEAYYNTPGQLRDAPCPVCGGKGTRLREDWVKCPQCWNNPDNPVIDVETMEHDPCPVCHDRYYLPGPTATSSQGKFGGYEEPVCLIHNLHGWGYGALADGVRELGVKLYGRGSPDGLINHREVPDKLAKTLAYVHLKSSDAPGYALYEALAAGCPVVCTRRLIWRNRMQDLFIPGETCLVFDRETHDGLSAQDVRSCLEELRWALGVLRDPFQNARIGANGRLRLKQLMWSDANPADVDSLREFFRRNFP